MTNNLRLAHLQSLRHPVEKTQISPEIQIHKFAHKTTTTVPRAAPFSSQIPFRKINSVIYWLNPQQRKCKQERKSTQYNLELPKMNSNANMGLLLFDVSDLQPDYGLEKARPIVAAWKIRMLQHLLSNFAIEFGRDVAEVALDVYELVEPIKLAIHFQHRDLHHK
ncbi:hypothetical protein STAS_06245 [Striga asiatica]|uniref:Uncharacterized protein n=1 Tax=Striga asiatica TaxID=4170 RepID=A0A5A7PDE6_STRAF|nr:hypothetical protein STAS_06245 [Striga asiatica]